MIGAFYQPKCVISGCECLEDIAKSRVISGFSGGHQVWLN